MIKVQRSSAPSNAARVDFDDVWIEFDAPQGKVTAVRDITVTLNAGTFTALVGPTGCGKSTILNAVAGFVSVSSGSLTVADAAVRGPGPERGVVFQQFALFPWLTARGNVEFALKRFRFGRQECRALATEYLQRVGLGDKAGQFPGQLSGGMRQRVALARTLAAEPSVLLMDEPFGALDAQTRLVMQQLLLSTWMDSRVTVLFVTHDVDEALAMADRVLVMSKSPGTIIEDMWIDAPRNLDLTELRAGHADRRACVLGHLRRVGAFGLPASMAKPQQS